MRNAHVASIVRGENQLVPEDPEEQAGQAEPRLLQEEKEQAEE